MLKTDRFCFILCIFTCVCFLPLFLNLLFCVASIRDITAEVGAAVLRAAVAEEVAEGHGEVGPKDLLHMSKVG